MKRGFFITFEGGEGSGKSTQARRLVAALRRRGRRPVHTREPGGTAIAEAVRRVLLTPGGRVAPVTELLLYEAARAQHLAEVVRPALARGRVVVCERYTDATEAYQGFGRGLPLADIRLLNRVATGGLAPDLTFLLDVPVRRGLRVARRLGKKLSRRAGRSRGGDRMERESSLFHERVRRGYLSLARREPRRVRVIPWGASIGAVHEGVLKETLAGSRGRR
ncbi:MAG: dTMP kinase [Elusimicrobia bacterium]|nr:MAG: dTMP kinase [Elusimicrobiota bacterium]